MAPKMALDQLWMKSRGFCRKVCVQRYRKDVWMSHNARVHHWWHWSLFMWRGDFGGPTDSLDFWYAISQVPAVKLLCLGCMQVQSACYRSQPALCLAVSTFGGKFAETADPLHLDENFNVSSWKQVRNGLEGCFLLAKGHNIPLVSPVGVWTPTWLWCKST